jgi:hypothetical protein
VKTHRRLIIGSTLLFAGLALSAGWAEAARLDGAQLRLSSLLDGKTVSYRKGDRISVPMKIAFSGSCATGTPTTARIYQTAGNSHPIWRGGYISQLPPSLIGGATLENGTGKYTFSTVATGDSSSASPLYWQGFFAVVECDGWLSSNSIDTHEVAPSGRTTRKTKEPIIKIEIPPIPPITTNAYYSGRCSRFSITARGFRPNEAVTAVEEKPDGRSRTQTLVANLSGVARVVAGGCGQQRGVHRWTFTGRHSHRRLTVSYTVR